MEYNFNEEQAAALNLYVAGVLKKMKDEIEMEFVTDSLYV